ncbi:MAG: C-terminal binding protein [Phycisphaeraceae bacterium]|nr:C-terminal binding protein [Phycisphaeraceae bacterium]
MNDGYIAVIDAGYSAYDFEKHVFEQQGYRFDVFPGETQDLAGKLQFAKEAVGLLLRWTPVNDAFLSCLPHLKAIVRYGVGYDNVDLAATERRQIRVANVQSYANHSVSDHALALIFGCARGLPLGQQTVQTGFGKPPCPDVFELSDRTLGIIGLGRIGGTLCTKAQSLFKTVLAADPYIPAERFTQLNATPCDLPGLLAEVDVVSLHCNLTEETRGLLGPDAFNTMTRQPILINTARGPLVDPDALLQALQQQTLHSAGLDVYPEEPPGQDLLSLLKHPRVIATGHYAWYSTRSSVELQKRAALNLLGLLSGKHVDDELTSLPSR